jgi:Rps23 Pro-64 3,4-dihydroxylase Tpa1-like proline 4-hydroxylase
MDRPVADYRREDIADAIIYRLDSETIALASQQFSSSSSTRWFFVDELLPPEMALAIRDAFPDPAAMVELRTLREHKYVASQMSRYARTGEEALFAFHDPRVVQAIEGITGLPALAADPLLYAGGLSLMTRDHFLNPHLDNSHNHDRSLYRALNLLYYVSPGWSLQHGGNLELWPDGVRGAPVTIESRFNRLVVMTTGPGSWHSVSRVRHDEARCCVSNYYFSPHPVGGEAYRRVTTFRGRPEQPLQDLVLRADGWLRQAARAIRPQGFVKTKHIYQRKSDPPAS